MPDEEMTQNNDNPVQGVPGGGGVSSEKEEKIMREPTNWLRRMNTKADDISDENALGSQLWSLFQRSGQMVDGDFEGGDEDDNFDADEYRNPDYYSYMRGTQLDSAAPTDNAGANKAASYDIFDEFIKFTNKRK